MKFNTGKSKSNASKSNAALLAKSKANNQVNNANANNQADPVSSNPLAAALANSKPATSSNSNPLKAQLQKPSADQLSPLANMHIDLSAPAAVPTNVENYKYQEQADSCDDATVSNFYSLMHDLVNKFEHPELNESMRNCREYLQTHPELKSILKPDDIHMLVRGLRETYGKALSSRTANKKKRSKKEEAVNELLGDLSGFSL